MNLSGVTDELLHPLYNGISHESTRNDRLTTRDNLLGNGHGFGDRRFFVSTDNMPIPPPYTVKPSERANTTILDGEINRILYTPNLNADEKIPLYEAALNLCLQFHPY
jgi:hypothetical protein